MALEVIINDIAITLETKRYKKPNGDIIIDIPLEFTHDDLDTILLLLKEAKKDKLQLTDDELEETLRDIVLKDKKEEAYNKLPFNVVENLVLEAHTKVIKQMGFERAEALISAITK